MHGWLWPVQQTIGNRVLSSHPHRLGPWVYWFPLSGNLTKEGITADLEAMQRVGIGGVLYMEVDQGAAEGPGRFCGTVVAHLVPARLP